MIQFIGYVNDLRSCYTVTLCCASHHCCNLLRQEWGWEVFQSIEKYCKTAYGYGSLKNVDNPSMPPEDRMESFFLAETMKYLYLLFDPDSEIDILNKVSPWCFSGTRFSPFTVLGKHSDHSHYFGMSWSKFVL